MKKKLTSALLGLSLLGQYAAVSPTYASVPTSENQDIQTQDKNKKANTTQDQNKETETTDNKILTPKNIAIASAALGIPLAAGLTWYFWPSNQKENNTPEDINAYREFVLKMWNDKNKWARNILTTNHGQKKTQYYISCDKAFECLKNAFLSLSKNGSFDPSLLQKACAEANILPEEHDVYCLKHIYIESEQDILRNLETIEQRCQKIIGNVHTNANTELVAIAKASIYAVLYSPHSYNNTLTLSKREQLYEEYCKKLEDHLKKKLTIHEKINSEKAVWQEKIASILALFHNKKIFITKNILDELDIINPDADPKYKEAYACMLKVFHEINSGIPSNELIEELAEKFEKVGIELDDFSFEACLRVRDLATCSKKTITHNITALLRNLERHILFRSNIEMLQNEKQFMSWVGPQLKFLHGPESVDVATTQLNHLRKLKIKAFQKATPEEYRNKVKDLFEELKRVNEGDFQSFCRAYIPSHASKKYKDVATELQAAFNELQLGNEQISDKVARQLAKAFKAINILPEEITPSTFSLVVNMSTTQNQKDLKIPQQKAIKNIEENMRELDNPTLLSDATFEDWAVKELRQSAYIPSEDIPQYVEKLLKTRQQILEVRKK